MVIDSDDLPLTESTGRHKTQQPLDGDHEVQHKKHVKIAAQTPTKSRILPLVPQDVFTAQPPQTPTRRRNSSLPPSPRKLSISESPEDRGLRVASSDHIVSPQTEKRILAQRRAAKKKATSEGKKHALQEQAHHEASQDSVHEEKERLAASQFFDGILNSIHTRGYSLAHLFEYVFDPTTRLARDYRYGSFFKHQTRVRRIFGFWSASKSTKAVRKFVKGWAVGLVSQFVRKESKGILQDGMLRTMRKTINKKFFLEFSLRDLTKRLRSKAEVMFEVAGAFASTPRQLATMSPQGLERKELIEGSAILSLLKGASTRNSRLGVILGTYLMATGAARQHYSILRSLGVTSGYNSIIGAGDAVHLGEDSRTVSQRPGALLQLSESCCFNARHIASVGLFTTVYDNINMMFRVAEQILGRRNAQENGTCATMVPLFDANLTDMLTEDIEKGIINARKLQLSDIDLTDKEADLYTDMMVHAILRIIVTHGGDGFAKWTTNLKKSTPVTDDKIPVHQTAVHPLPAMEIDESSIAGNIEVLETIWNELEIRGKKGMEEDTAHAKIVAGDQLTIARQRSILNVRLGHENGVESWRDIVLMPGLFHPKILNIQQILETHFGKPGAGTRSPGGLAFHNTVLGRLPIVLSSMPTFSICRDLVMVSLYARVLHCLLLVSGKPTLEAYLESVTSWDAVRNHAREIYSKYADADFVSELREKRARATEQAEATATDTPVHTKVGDMVYENGLLFLRDGLHAREFADAVRRGDSGRVIVILKIWVYTFHGGGHSKYAHEMLHIIHNLVNVWPKEFRDIIIKNWLVNPTGKEDGFLEIDLLQEHLNYWIKVMYKADGDAHSWDWLAMVSPCIDVLRHLAKTINAEIGAHQGSSHTNPSLAKDIRVLMQSLLDLKVYVYVEGRVLDEDEEPAKDVLTDGAVELSKGDALADFNAQCDRARARRGLTPIADLLDLLEPGNPLRAALFGTDSDVPG
ncbi:hypothetical protein OF83DRAFT_1072222 [Amylostereum chailletii]|nr:hypothetical protein OF83DRAFT_1072222 [Amylostereum chailletii]